MARNIVLLLATLAILGVLFVGYVLLVREPVRLQEPAESPAAALPAPAPGSAPTLRVADAVELPPGHGVQFTVYEERTGRPSQRFYCQEWTPVPGTTNQVTVKKPQMTLWLAGGMTVTISAEEGELTVDRLERGAGRPRKGRLHANVQVVAERGRTQDQEAQAADSVTVRLDDLDFDLERGELKTVGPVELVSQSFQLAGIGLSVVWNQADNVLESLELAQGERLVLVALARTLSAGQPRSAASTPASVAQTSARRGDRGKTNSYTCTLTGGIQAEQYVDDRLVGGLTADEIRLLFDFSGTDNLSAAGRGPTNVPTSGRAAASQPEARPRQERLVVHWNGPLRVRPAPPPATPAASREDRPRRHFEAMGQEVVLTRQDAMVRCRRLQYFDETGQIWLYPAPEGQVEFGLGQDVTAAADGVYVDTQAGLVKLVGNVRLEGPAAGTSRLPGQRAKLRSLRCDLWARLYLRSGKEANAGVTDWAAADRLAAASFTGNACVDLGNQVLTADRIDVRFAPQAEEATDEPALESAVATGGVRLRRGQDSLRCARLELFFARTGQGEPYPRQMGASGSVVLSRSKSWLRGDRVEAELAPAPQEADQEFVVRRLDVRGRAELRDWRNSRRQIAARGERISAEFSGINQLENATVTAPPELEAMVHVTPYTVISSRIELAREAQTLKATGPARLSFETTRGLRGRQRSRPTPIVVTCEGPLEVDGMQNVVNFFDRVVAESGQEQLTADRLTLLLQDAEKPVASAPAPQLSIRDLLGPLARIFEPGQPSDRGTLELALPAGAGMRKEPVRLIAENALLVSEQSQAGAAAPAVHSSIAAPRLEADLVNRQIVTQGQTTLLVVNHLPADEGGPGPEALGPVSALIMRGPSQTAMRCDGSMTYVLGEEPQANEPAGRRDWVLFEGDVVLRHRAGESPDRLPFGGLESPTPPPNEGQEPRGTWLQCDRLECVLLVREDEATGAPAAPGRSIRIVELIASGRAELRDQHGSKVRSVFAPQFDFDRGSAVVRVLGTAQSLARVYEEDQQSGEVRTLVGEHFVIDLERGVVRSGPARGEFRAP
jgi:lipopolysaccharide export system protein LptA